jgi:methionyl-tRNA formyltransferase
MSANLINIAVAGSTQHTVWCLKNLAKSNFKINWVLTPQPKKVGRQQRLIQNPVHAWAQEHNIPIILVSKKIDYTIKNKINQQKNTAGSNQQTPDNSNPKNQLDLLLVVDFGYIIPDWLLNLPHKATVNLHPSKLPEWRGSSPGQMVILYGQKSSAVTLIRLTHKLDAGPIIQQLEFKLEPTWTSGDYYQHSFKLASKHLAAWLRAYVDHKLIEQPQPAQSPTPIARRLHKQDSFVPWELVQLLINSEQTKNKVKPKLLNQHDFPQKSVLRRVLNQQNPRDWAVTLERASRAFQPWPILWTQIPTHKREKRMQILSCQVKNKNQNKNTHLVLDKVKIAGQKEANWNQIKNQLKSAKDNE